MKKSFAKPLHRTAWVLFIALLFLNVVNWGFSIKDDFFQRRLPFRIENGKAATVEDSTLIGLRDRMIISIDTLQVANFQERNDKHRGRLVIFQQDISPETKYLDEALPLVLRNKKEVDIVYQDSLQISNLRIGTLSERNYSVLLNLGFNAVFLLFIFFNSFLLLKYSLHSENILIVLFLLLLACPNRISADFSLAALNSISAGLLGLLFYHFVLEKIGVLPKLKVLYGISLALIIITIILNRILPDSADLILYIWSLFWLAISFFRLWKAYKASDSIELKRLLNAFQGLFTALAALLAALLAAMILYLLAAGQTEFSIYNLQMGVLVVFILLAMLIFLLSILWFFGAFTWSLLTGTALGVKIRSTMIYTIVGVVFVVFFGLLDYSLGELLQTLFGRFMGSEFIAGIPATIGLLAFFNPVRQRVERMVDSKLNTSELDFLEKTDTFSAAIAGEGVIEGFEEYICENLIRRLPIKKVALISYDRILKAYKFSETRGSDVQENSLVKDVHLYLLENKMQRNYAALNEDPQEIASFSLIIPIIYDPEHKWYLALGKKTDGTSYTKKDEEALAKLAEKIKLSLKFILAYENIINNRHANSLQEKDLTIAGLQKQVAELALILSEKNIGIEES